MVVAGLTCAAMTQAQYFNFNDPVTTGPSQSPGVWYTDRYAPAGFEAGVNFLGDARLRQTISAADSQSNRPGPFSSAFYNTQGRKYDVDAGVMSMSIELYVDSAWQTTGNRMAGFWGTAIGGSSLVYPIIEVASDGNDAWFRAWDATTGLFHNMGMIGALDQFYELSITLDLGTNTFLYEAGGYTWQSTAFGATSFGNVILQGHNSLQGENYDIYWDNFNAAGANPVPEPITMSLMAGGVALAVRRKLKAKKG